MFDLTSFTMMGFVAAILLLDLFLYLTGRKTYSQKTIELSKKYPLIPFAWGFLMGHFFG